MLKIDRLIRERPNLASCIASIIYALSSAIALNMFLLPGGLYTSGITGASQLLARLAGHSTGQQFLTTGNINLLINLQLFFLSWRLISHRLTLYTGMTVVLSSIAIDQLKLTALTKEPIICGIFGAIVWGFGTGVGLRANISTGGLDIVELLLHRYLGYSVGAVNTLYNTVLLVIAGACYGWAEALVSVLSIYISSRIVDAQYTRQHRLQALIVTQQAEGMLAALQEKLSHGVTVMPQAVGGYSAQPETVLLIVITSSETDQLLQTAKKIDESSFISITPVTLTAGRFTEPVVP